jgi:tetratricopeptide (TPR) repeat protein
MNPYELSNICYKAKAYQSENRHNEALKCFNNALELKPKIEQKKLLLITKAEIFRNLARQIRLGKC